MYAAEGGNTKIVRLFLDIGLDVNVTDNDGDAVLIYAATYPEIVRLLIDEGANIDARNKNDNSVFDYANDKTRKILCRYLEKKKIRNIRVWYGENIFGIIFFIALALILISCAYDVMIYPELYGVTAHWLFYLMPFLGCIPCFAALYKIFMFYLYRGDAGKSLFIVGGVIFIFLYFSSLQKLYKVLSEFLDVLGCLVSLLIILLSINMLWIGITKGYYSITKRCHKKYRCKN